MKGVFLNAFVRKQRIEILFAFVIKTFSLCGLFVESVPVVQHIDSADGKIDFAPVRAAYAIPCRPSHARKNLFGGERQIDDDGVGRKMISGGFPQIVRFCSPVERKLRRFRFYDFISAVPAPPCQIEAQTNTVFGNTVTDGERELFEKRAALFCRQRNRGSFGRIRITASVMPLPQEDHKRKRVRG